MKNKLKNKENSVKITYNIAMEKRNTAKEKKKENKKHPYKKTRKDKNE